ncbi:hypothetical protein AOL_s00054g779 [Orbilia oligospora ATCC 24927]|uniref:Uncharacterized protein n=1 Tax=Arthrobotrys oligospora (strain ATCC 24927 / CBS 115.81 / DSM 1491) TaxID=756982 RepID=G1X7D5_ARTOA|nr:hypothetical protein AOL_s00054g779 [Orbilia oligospora ATCC 24927]EGX51043.1 hypothetical protein AOL_s00054g779 [Orbilia oligospora ATCC 24927]
MSATQKTLDTATILITSPIASPLLGINPAQNRCGEGYCGIYGGSAKLEFCGDWGGYSNYCCSGLGIAFGSLMPVPQYPCEDVPGLTDTQFDQFGTAAIPVNLDCPNGTIAADVYPDTGEYACCPRNEIGVVRLQVINRATGAVDLQGIRCFDPKIVKLENMRSTTTGGLEPTPTTESSSSMDGTSSSSSSAATMTDETSESSIATQSSVSRGQTTTMAGTTSTDSLPEPSSSSSEDLGSPTESSPTSESPATSTPTPNSASNGLSKMASLMFGTAALAMVIGAQL